MSELEDTKEAHLAALKALASGGTVIVNLQLRVNRMAVTIARYRLQLEALSANAASHIADIERDLTDDDRERIG